MCPVGAELTFPRPVADSRLDAKACAAILVSCGRRSADVDTLKRSLKMPRPGTYPYQLDSRENLHIGCADGRRFCFNVPAGSYSVTVYDDGTYGVVLPEDMRGIVAVQTGSSSVCIPAISFCVDR